MRYFLFNKHTKEFYREPCPYDGKMEVVHFDTRTRAESCLPSKKWSVVDWKAAFYPKLCAKGPAGFMGRFNAWAFNNHPPYRAPNQPCDIPHLTITD